MSCKQKSVEMIVPALYTNPEAKMIRRTVLLSLVSSLASSAQMWPWEEATAWQQPPGETRISPKSTCSSLQALTGYEFSIISARLIPASKGRPEFCRVSGLIQPEIKFEVALPLSWHGRLLMMGNGGYAGEDLDFIGRAMMRDSAVSSGFAFTQTNTGHEAEGEPLGAFAINPQKLLDYAFRAVHVTAETAKRIAAAYYGIVPKRSYFVGCSTGGRQGLIAAQRFPADFDGISAGAPVLDFVSTQVNYVPVMRAMAEAPVSEEKLKLVGKIVYTLCDEKDGLKDGSIDDPRRCGFKPSMHLPRCSSGDAADCFTDGQIHTLETLHSDQYIKGQKVFPGWPVGAEAEAPVVIAPGVILEGHSGWYRWLVRGDQPPDFTQFSEAFFRYMAEPQKRPKLQLSELDFDRNPPRLDWIRETLNATDPDLSAFRDRGGKLLMWFGWADPALNPLMGIDYYEAASRKMGASTPDFFRLYMLPGVLHCFGGIGCDSAPRLAALIDWVERGKAPDSILASRIVAGKVIRTRPLCPYPRVAKYKGSGNIDEASNFVCAASDAR
jgi:feruloyl esterase